MADGEIQGEPRKQLQQKLEKLNMKNSKCETWHT